MYVDTIAVKVDVTAHVVPAYVILFSAIKGLIAGNARTVVEALFTPPIQASGTVTQDERGGVQFHYFGIVFLRQINAVHCA